MFSRVSIANFIPGILVLCLWAQTLHPRAVGAQQTPGSQPLGQIQVPQQQAPASPALQQLPTQQPPGATVFKADQLTKEQFKQLPDSAVIEFQGQRTTKGEFRAKMEQARNAAMMEAQAQASQAEARRAAHRARFLQRQQVELDAASAKVQVELARLGQAGSHAQISQMEGVQQKAANLCARSKTASPAEQAQMEREAGELLKQFRQLGR